jgi:hypothetical protein
MFMAGRRSKRLMMDGYNTLSTEDRIIVDKAAEKFNGDVFELLAYVDGYRDPETGAVNRREFIKSAAAVVAAMNVGTDSVLDKAAKKIIRPHIRKLKTTPGRADTGRIIDPRRNKNYERSEFNWIKRLMDEAGATKQEAEQQINKTLDELLSNQSAKLSRLKCLIVLLLVVVSIYLQHQKLSQ